MPQSPDKNGNIPTNESTGQPYRTPEVVEIFDSKEACFAAYQKRFGNSQETPVNDTEAELKKILKDTPWAGSETVFIKEAQKYHGKPLAIITEKLSMKPGDTLGKAMALATGEENEEYYKPF